MDLVMAQFEDGATADEVPRHTVVDQVKWIQAKQAGTCDFHADMLTHNINDVDARWRSKFLDYTVLKFYCFSVLSF